MIYFSETFSILGWVDLLESMTVLTHTQAESKAFKMFHIKTFSYQHYCKEYKKLSWDLSDLSAAEHHQWQLVTVKCEK